MPYKSKEQQREYQRQWIAARRAEFFKDKKCGCGSDKDLDLDHIDPEQKVSHRIWSWSEKRRLEELAKCQVLCEKCHKKKTYQDVYAKITHCPRGHEYTKANTAWHADSRRCRMCYTAKNAARYQ